MAAYGYNAPEVDAYLSQPGPEPIETRVEVLHERLEALEAERDRYRAALERAHAERLDSRECACSLGVPCFIREALYG